MSDRNFSTSPNRDESSDDENAPVAPSETSGGGRELVLVKHGQRFIFRYEPGDETRVLAEILELARNPDSKLDAFDAAVLSHQMGVQLSEQLKCLNKAS